MGHPRERMPEIGIPHFGEGPAYASRGYSPCHVRILRDVDRVIVIDKPMVQDRMKNKQRYQDQEQTDEAVSPSNGRNGV